MNELRHDGSPWRALGHRDFRLFMAGRALTLCGTWMQTMAQAWLIYRLTGSPFLLGLMETLTRTPILIFGLFGGVLADRWPRHRLMVIAQSLLLGQAALLTGLALSGHLTVAWLLGLGLLLGLISALDVPVRQAFVTDLVPRHDIPSAIGLNSSVFNATRIVGPSLAGFTVASFGAGACFLVSTCSFLVILACLLAMRIAPMPPLPLLSVTRQLREGLAYVRQTPHARIMLLLSGGLSVVAMPYSTLLPVFAGDVLHSGPIGLGWLMAANGVGAMGAALHHARRHTIHGLGVSIASSVGLFGAGLVAFALSETFWLSALALIAIGYGMVSSLAGGNILLQMAAPEVLRGRVVSLYATLSLGTTIFGSLLGGIGATYFGAPMTILVGGGLTLAMGAWAWRGLSGEEAQGVTPPLTSSGEAAIQ